MRRLLMLLCAYLLTFGLFTAPAFAQDVIPLTDKGGLHAAYVVPSDRFNRVDVQLIVLSGYYDDPDPSGTAHFTEHLAAWHSDAKVLKRPRERDLNAYTSNVSTVYTNSGPPEDIERLLRLSRAVLETPDLPPGFVNSEISIVQRETLLRERRSPLRWIKRKSLQNLYGTLRGRANNTIADLPYLNVEAAFEFHKTHYVPSNVTLIISGKIEPEKAAELVTRIFGDTEPGTPPAKPWLDHKPDPSLRAVETIESDRLAHNTVLMTKFMSFDDRHTSIDMQGMFFIGVSVLDNRLFKELYYERADLFDIDTSWFFARNADLEYTVIVRPMPHVSLEEAHSYLENTIAGLLDTPITAEEIASVRKEEMVKAQNAARNPARFRGFLENIASDGFPPISPSTFAEQINATTDAEVIAFAERVVRPSASSTILARKVE